MTRQLKLLAFLCCVLITAQGTTQADLILDIGNATGSSNPVEVTQGTRARIQIVATTTLTTNLSGYNLAIDFGGNDFGLLGPQFSNFSATPIVGGFTGTLGFDQTTAPFLNNGGASLNWDFLVSHNGGSNSYATGETIGFFNLEFDVAADATTGVVHDIRIPTNQEMIDVSGVGTEQNTNAPGNVPFIINNGSFVVTAVPEPGSLLVLGFGGIGLILVRRRK